MEASVMLSGPFRTEQQDTLALLHGCSEGDRGRYVDFCVLADRSIRLNVARPIAAHALRELDSMLRAFLKCRWRLKQRESGDIDGIEKAKQQLTALGFDERAIVAPRCALKPRFFFSAKTQIRKSSRAAGLAPDGDVAIQDFPLRQLWESASALVSTFP